MSNSHSRYQQTMSSGSDIPRTHNSERYGDRRQNHQPTNDTGSHSPRRLTTDAGVYMYDAPTHHKCQTDNRPSRQPRQAEPMTPREHAHQPLTPKQRRKDDSHSNLQIATYPPHGTPRSRATADHTVQPTSADKLREYEIELQACSEAIATLENDNLELSNQLSQMRRERNLLMETHMGLYHEGLNDINSTDRGVSKELFQIHLRQVFDAFKGWAKQQLQHAKADDAQRGPATGDDWLANLPMYARGSQRVRELVCSIISRSASSTTRRSLIMAAAAPILFAGFADESLATTWQSNASQPMIRTWSSGMHQNHEANLKKKVDAFRKLADSDDSDDGSGFGPEFRAWAAIVSAQVMEATNRRRVIDEANGTEPAPPELFPVLRKLWVLHLLSGCFPTTPALIWPAEGHMVDKEASSLVERSESQEDSDDDDDDAVEHEVISTFFPGFRFKDVVIGKARALTVPRAKAGSPAMPPPHTS